MALGLGLAAAGCGDDGAHDGQADTAVSSDTGADSSTGADSDTTNVPDVTTPDTATSEDAVADTTADTATPEDTSTPVDTTTPEDADVVVVPGSFAIGASASATAQYGAPGTIVVTIARNDFDALVTVVPSGVPDGVHLDPDPVTFGGAATEVSVAVTVDSDADVDEPATITWTATAGDVTRTATTTLTIVDQPSFTLQAGGAAGYPGDARTLTASVQRGPGFTADVVVSFAAPTGISTSPVTLHDGQPNATLPVVFASDVTPGIRFVTITATGGGVTRTVETQIQAYPKPLVELTAVGGDVSLAAGDSLSVGVTIAHLSDAPAHIELAIDGLPTGVTADATSLDLEPSVTSASFVLTAAAGAGAASATATITARAVGPDLEYGDSVSFVVAIVPPPPFTFAVVADEITIEQSDSATLGVDIVRDAAFHGEVVIDSLSAYDDVAFTGATIAAGETHAEITFAADADALVDLPRAFTLRASGGDSSATAQIAARVRAIAAPDLDDTWAFHGTRVLDVESSDFWNTLIGAACGAEGCYLMTLKGRVVAVDATGARRTGWGDDGMFVPSSGVTIGQALVRAADGSLYVMGVPSGTRFNLWHVGVDGLPDPAFASGGMLEVDVTGFSTITRAALANDGGLWIVGIGPSDGVIVKTTAGGAWDTDFGGDGRVDLDLGGNEQIRGVVADGDGVIVFGDQSVPSGRAVFFARLDASGALDPSFDDDGVLSLPATCVDYAITLLDVGDGQLLGVGSTCQAIAAWRIARSGALDEGFGSDGVATPFSAAANPNVADAVVTADGGIAVLVTNESAFTIARMTSDGELDASASATGLQSLTFGPGGPFSTGLAADSQGFVAVGGVAGYGVAARFTAP